MTPSMGELFKSGLKIGDRIRDKATRRVGKVVLISKVRPEQVKFDGTHEIYVCPPITFDPILWGYTRDITETIRLVDGQGVKEERNYEIVPGTEKTNGTP